MASKKYDSLAELADEKPADTGGDSEDTGEGDLPPEFESAAVEAFPDLDGDTKRLQALYDAIEACHGGGGKPGLAIMIGSKGKR